MSILNDARLIVYRCHEKGLEVLCIKNKLDTDTSIWFGSGTSTESKTMQESIELDQQVSEDGIALKVLAVEADWHQIPSVRGIIRHDIKRLKTKIKKNLPEQTLEGYTYLKIKEALASSMPQEYKLLKELKDIIIAKNQLKSI